MLKKYLTLFAFVILITARLAFVQGQDAKAVVIAAAKAMGAENLRTIQFTGSGSNAGIGQNISPSRAWPMVRVKSYIREIDLEALASNVRAVRIQNNTDVTQTQVISANAPWSQQFDIWVMPHAFLKGAMANPVTLRTERIGDLKYTVIAFIVQNRYRVEGYINDQNMVERVRTWIDNNVMGDMMVEGVYADYKDFGGVKFPTFLTVKQGGFPTLILNLNDAKANLPVTIPAATPTAAVTLLTVESEKIADGVYYLKGGTHHSVLVEFADHVTLIEAPQNEPRALALLEEARKLFPNKPLTQVVNTHHHFDHSGGLRAFVDAGATVVTHEINKPFYEKTFSAERTLNPDRLAQSKRQAKVLPVADKLAMKDATRTIEMHLVRDNPHHEGILMVFLPKERILVEADLYTPPNANAAAIPQNAPVNPNAVSLLENLERLRLDFDTILPLHGPGKVIRADLYTFIRKPLVAVSALPDPNATPAAGGRGGGGGRGGRGGRGGAPASEQDAAAAAVVNNVCAGCHTLARVNAVKADRTGWAATVNRMRSNGADLTDEQFSVVIEYLTKTQAP